MQALNLIEAVKSNKPFKRPCWENYCVIENISHPIFIEENYAVFMNNNLIYGAIDLEDLIADDYEIGHLKVLE